MPRKASKPTCGHPNLKVAGHGKCSKCYENSRKSRKKLYKSQVKYQQYLKTPRVVAEAKYRASVHKRADYRSQLPSLIDTIYETAIEFYMNCPDGMVVDHIIPINNPEVCGLHVFWNFQYLSEEDNYMKKSSFDGTYENKSWRSIRIKCLNTGEMFKTPKQAADKLNLDSSSLIKVLKGKYTNTKGYKFEYFNTRPDYQG